MKHLSILLAFIAVLIFSMAELADAKRLGGSKSFGSKPSFSTSAPKAPSSGSTSSVNQTNRNTTGAAGAGAATATAGRSGFGMMGGLFGGLLAGTFLGSMLGGLPGGGGFLDIIIIGLLVYFGFRLFSSFSKKKDNNSQQQQAQTHNYSQQKSTLNNAWSNLKSEPTESTQTQEQSNENSYGIDPAEFLEGAKATYVRMQESWDKRDIEDIKIFTSSAVYDVVKQDSLNDPNPSSTVILNLSAQINAIEKDGDKDRISVYFIALLNEDGEQSNVTELWHFVRDNKFSMWKVDGIQQVR